MKILFKKIISPKKIGTLSKQLKNNNKILVFTNGCYDILHIGHVQYLNASKEYGDILIVAVNSDASIRSQKGKLRPIIPLLQRLKMLAALACVDYVTYFATKTPHALIQSIKPHFLTKGGDYTEKKIIGKELLSQWNGKVIVPTMVQHTNTTSIINKIIQKYQ